MKTERWIARQWPALVGPCVAAVTQPGPVAPDGTLTVRVSSDLWYMELPKVMERIRDRLNARPGERVTGIEWVVDRGIRAPGRG